MKWFGPSWGAPVNEHCAHTATPVGQPCARCEHPIIETDQGLSLPSMGPRCDDHRMVFHKQCLLDTIGVPVLSKSVLRRLNITRPEPD